MRHPARARFAPPFLPTLAAAGLLAAALTCGLAFVPVEPARAALAVVGVDDNASGRHDRTLTIEAPGVLANDGSSEPTPSSTCPAACSARRPR
jgi:hypothetical protein